MVELAERRCDHCSGDMSGKRRGARYCSRRCKTAASDGRRRDDGRAQGRDHARYRSEAAHRRDYAREQSRQLRQLVRDHYGHCCAICGATERLELDHAHGNGESHRDIVGHGDRFYRWLLRENFPPECERGGAYELQVLCRKPCHLEKTNRERRERG